MTPEQARTRIDQLLRQLTMLSPQMSFADTLDFKNAAATATAAVKKNKSTLADLEKEVRNLHAILCRVQKGA